MRWSAFLASLWLVLASLEFSLADVVPGLASDFEDGTLQNWDPPAGNTSNVAGGPAGSTRFLQISPAGGSRRIAAFNPVNYTGSIAEAVAEFAVDFMRPAGEPALEMRLVLMGPTSGDRWTSTTAQTVPGDGVWRTYTFPISEGNLTRVLGNNTYAALRGSLNRLMFRWDTGGPSATGTPGGTGSLGMDHVVARAAAAPSPFEIWAAENIPDGGDRSFAGDADGDGDPNGYEYGVGADGGVPDTSSPRKLTLVSEAGGARMNLAFGFRPGGGAGVSWILERARAAPADFQEIYRRAGGVETRGPNIESRLDPTDATKLIVTDGNPGSRAFYRLLVVLEGAP